MQIATKTVERNNKPLDQAVAREIWNHISTISAAAPQSRHSVFAIAARNIAAMVSGGKIIKTEAIDRLYSTAVAIGLEPELIQVELALAFGEAPITTISNELSEDSEIVSRGQRGLKKKKSGVILSRMDNVEMRPIEWLWPDRLAVGKLTVLAGEGGLGKTTVLLDMAARGSIGEYWPDMKSRAPIFSTIILSSEDDPSDTIKPRLEAATADMSKIYFVDMVREESGSERTLNLQADLAALEKKIAEIGDVRLVIIDPITSYLGRTDSHKNAEVRSVLGPLSEMAARRRVAVIGNTHFSKSEGKNANSKIIGSVAFVNQARMAIVITEDPEDKDRRLFIPSKPNISHLSEGFAYRIEQTLVGPSKNIVATRIAWESGCVTMSADEAVAAIAGDNERKTAKAEAIEFLKTELAGGPRPVADVQKLARSAGIGAKPLRSARECLGVTTDKIGFEDGWVWSLPKVPNGAEGAYKENGASSRGAGIFEGAGA
jgi:putative DNA primase/helicase